MRARIWGCRGSVAAPGPETVRHGGNTSCVEVRFDDGTVIVLDAGTGIRPLGIRLKQEGVSRIHLLLSHLHLDHLQGLGFFAPLYDPGVELHIWGPASPVESLEDRIAMYMSPPLFPVRLADIPSHVVFHDAPEEPVAVGCGEFQAALVTHQGPTVGFRISENGASLAYLPDHEPALGVPLPELPASWISGHGLADGVDVLLHDAQYTHDEYPDHVGWGHSSIDHVVDFAKAAGVARLVLFHHDPHHDDDDLDRLGELARELVGAACDDVSMAFEGMELDVAPTPPRGLRPTSRTSPGPEPV